MMDLRAHTRWPELQERKRERDAVRERVLREWPDGVDPDDLPADRKAALAEAQRAVTEANLAYEQLLAVISTDVEAGHYGQP
jgi:hypothetical protein